MRRAAIVGTGHGLPQGRLTNEQLETMVETTDEWIRQRTGIRERPVASDLEATSDFAVMAAREALQDAGVSPEQLDLVIVGTVTGDYPFPSTACLVQSAIGAKRAGAFDVGAACAGFIYSLDVAAAMIESGRAETILVVGADALTKFVDFKDRSTCILFGDGAGAVVLKAATDGRGLIKSALMSDGDGARHILLEAGGSRYPQNDRHHHDKRPYIFMNGQETYRFAVNAMTDACAKVLAEAGLEISDVDLFVPHQANLRIITSAAEKLGLPDDKIFVNVDRYGNTSGGSIPLALHEAAVSGRLKPGMVVMTVGFGAGLVWGSNLIRW